MMLCSYSCLCPPAGSLLRGCSPIPALSAGRQAIRRTRCAWTAEQLMTERLCAPNWDLWSSPWVRSNGRSTVQSCLDTRPAQVDARGWSQVEEGTRCSPRPK
jgi:hypothetical protein